MVWSPQWSRGASASRPLDHKLPHQVGLEQDKDLQDYEDYTRAEAEWFEAEDVVFFFDDRPVQGVSEKTLPRWTGPHRVMAVINPQQYQLQEERTGRMFIAHRSRLRKTLFERLAEEGRRRGGGQFCSALEGLWTRTWTLL